MDIFHSKKYLSHDGRIQSLVSRVGRGHISKAGKSGTAMVIDQIWDVIRNNDRISASTVFPNYIVDGFESPASPIEASVLERVESSEIAFMYQSFVIDRGEDSGLRLGDIFTVHDVSKKAGSDESAVSANAVATACLVHLNKTSSTLVILGLKGTELSTGDRARIFKRTVLR